MMIKILHFTGPSSFATFLAGAGDTILPAMRIIRCFDRGNIVCFVDIGSIDRHNPDALLNAVRLAHAVEPILLDHDVEMSAAAMACVEKTLTKPAQLVDRD